MKIVFFDGYNLIHRARYGMTEGEFNTVYTFFRSFRLLVEQMKGDKNIITLEGNPKFRYELYPEYKANRKIDPQDSKKIEEYQNFKKQKDIIVSILSKLPVEVLQHPDYEGDDIIGRLATTVYKDDEVIVVTGDSDFIQLFNQHNNVKIYQPVKKEWVANPGIDYVLQKSLIGDTSDNISGIPGVGPKTAQKILRKTPEELEQWLAEKLERKEILMRNKKLIKFAEFSLSGILRLNNEVDFDWIKKQFEQMNFQSMLTDKAWIKFVDTFSY